MAICDKNKCKSLFSNLCFSKQASVVPLLSEFALCIHLLALSRFCHLDTLSCATLSTRFLQTESGTKRGRVLRWLLNIMIRKKKPRSMAQFGYDLYLTFPLNSFNECSAALPGGLLESWISKIWPFLKMIWLAVFCNLCSVCLKCLF